MSQKKFVIAIDPGKGGGVVSLTNGHITTVAKMPQSPKYLWDYFLSLGFPSMLDLNRTWVFIENVHSMPTDGKPSVWTFAKHVGQLEMLAELLSMSPAYITPQKWQKWLRESSMDVRKIESMTKAQWKSHLNVKAKEHAPEKWKKSITLATADAYWIALYGWEIVKNEEANTSCSETGNVEIPIR